MTTSHPDTPPPKKKGRRLNAALILKEILFGMIFFMICLTLALGGLALYYQDSFYPGVMVAGVSLEGRSEKEGRILMAELANSYANHPVKITIPDITQPRDAATNRYPEIEVGSTAGQLGLSMNSEEAVEKAWRNGHGRNVVEWAQQVIPTLFFSQSIDLPYTINQTAIQTFIDTQVLPKISNPVPAKVVVEGSEVKVDPGRPGLEIDKQDLVKLLAASLEQSGEVPAPTYLRAPVKEINSPITALTVQPIADRLVNLSNLAIAFKTEKLNLVPKKDQILSWFAPVQNEKGDLSLVVQKEVIAQYLQKNRTLDQVKSLDAATKALAPLASADIEKTVPGRRLAVAVVEKPEPVVTPGNATLGKYEGKYVEVVLAEQKLYLINGTNLERTYVVSTGKWSTPTTVGEFKIQNKIQRAYSRMYGLYMPYWAGFNGDYGIHELPEWPNGYKEGQSHLGTPVSHGCVRLGVGAAKEVWDWVSVGTPVYVH